MSLTINTNLSALIAHNSLKTSTNKLNQAIERMTTGYKINHAKDNAANYAIATQLSTKIGAYSVAEENAMMGLDMVQTASSSLDLMSDLASRLRALATQAQNGTYGTNSLTALNSEAQAIVQEMNRIKSTTTYNGIKLLGDDSVADKAIATLNAQSSSNVATFSTAQARAAVTVDESKRVSNVTSFMSGETYYLTTPDDLVALQDLVNSDVSTSGVNFEQAADIDMSGVEFEGIGSYSSFCGTYNGNEYKISNLTIDSTGNYVGLFAYLYGTAQNIILENCDISGGNSVGGIVAFAGTGSTISNCSVLGRVTSSYCTGGLVGTVSYNCKIENCTVNAYVVGNNYVGGLCGQAYLESRLKVNNTTVAGNITGNSNVGGLIGYAGDVYLSDCNIACKVNGSDTDTTGIIYGVASSDKSQGCTFTNVTYDGSLNSGMPLIGKDYDGNDTSGIIDSSVITPDPEPTPTPDPTPEPEPDPTPTPDPEPEPVPTPPTPSTPSEPSLPSLSKKNFSLGISISSSSTSQIDFELKDADISILDGLDLTDVNALSTIDEVIKSINEQQTTLGAVENRLTSALEQIHVAYDNLVSTQSTILDADIAEESSNYIKMQILQQASATLMATANQSPSIALQLL